jgi:hypothetical protein
MSELKEAVLSHYAKREQLLAAPLAKVSGLTATFNFHLARSPHDWELKQDVRKLVAAVADLAALVESL